MNMVLVYSNGRRIDAILLAAGSEKMRVAVRNRADAVELQHLGGKWVDEKGREVELEAITTDGKIEVTRLAETFPITLKAGG